MLNRASPTPHVAINQLIYMTGTWTTYTTGTPKCVINEAPTRSAYLSIPYIYVENPPVTRTNEAFLPPPPTDIMQSALSQIPTLLQSVPFFTDCPIINGTGQPTVHIPVTALTAHSTTTIRKNGNAPIPTNTGENVPSPTATSEDVPAPTTTGNNAPTPTATKTPDSPPPDTNTPEPPVPSPTAPGDGPSEPTTAPQNPNPTTAANPPPGEVVVPSPPGNPQVPEQSQPSVPVPTGGDSPPAQGNTQPPAGPNPVPTNVDTPPTPGNTQPPAGSNPSTPRPTDGSPPPIVPVTPSNEPELPFPIVPVPVPTGTNAGSSPATSVNPGAVVLPGDQTLNPGQQTTISGVVISVPSIQPTNPAAVPSVIVTEGRTTTIVPASPSLVVVDGVTTMVVAPTAPVVVIDGTTRTVPVVAPTANQAPAVPITLGTQVVSVKAPTASGQGVVLPNSETLAIGSTTTYAGETLVASIVTSGTAVATVIEVLGENQSATQTVTLPSAAKPTVAASGNKSGSASGTVSEAPLYTGAAGSLVYEPGAWFAGSAVGVVLLAFA